MPSPAQLPNSSGSHRFDLPELNVTAGAYSVRGLSRDQNEDCQYVSPDRSVFIVADGMGGHQAGEFASRFVVDALTHELDRLSDDDASVEHIRNHVKAAFEHANCLLLEAAENDPSYAGAGTTAILALVFGDRLFVSGIGDSRAYLLRDDTFEQLTQDDSLSAYLQRAGAITAEAAKVHPARNQLCAFLGMENFQPDEDIRILRLKRGDVVLLCSDGLTDVVDDAEIKATLMSHRNPQLAARQLVQTAVEHKGKDDVTCVVFNVARNRPQDSDDNSGGLMEMVRRWIDRFTQRPTPAV